jgi:hypothetical protein
MRSSVFASEDAEEGDIRLPCKHALHSACAAQWWLTSRSIQCPLCFFTVYTADWNAHAFGNAMLRVDRQQNELAMLRRTLQTLEKRQKIKTSINVFNVVCAFVLGLYSGRDTISLFLLSNAICFSITYDDAGYATPFLYVILWLQYGTPFAIEVAIRYLTISATVLLTGVAVACACRR